jgi:hypothetical protein
MKDAELLVSLTEEDLTLIKNFLEARKIYAPYGEVSGYRIWKPYMGDLLVKINAILAFLKDGESFVEADLD